MAQRRPDLRRRARAGRAGSCLFLPGAGRTRLEPATSCSVPLGAREATSVVWPATSRSSRGSRPPEGHRPQARCAAAQARATPIRRLGLGLYAGLARHGAADGAAHGRASRSSARARSACASPDRAPSRITSARRACACRLVRRPRAGKADVADEAGVSPGVVDGFVDEGTLESLVCRPSPSRGRPTRTLRRRLHSGAARARPRICAARCSAAASASPCSMASPARARPRSISRRWRMHPPGKQALVLMPEIALTTQFVDRFAARFGTRRRVASQLSPRLRARTWPAVACGRGQRRGRRALGVVRPTPSLGSSSSMRSTIPPTSRRTACATTRATWRWCGRGRRDPDRAGVGDAVRRNRGECAARPLRARPSAGAVRRPASCRGSRRSTCAPKARRGDASSRRGWPRR